MSVVETIPFSEAIKEFLFVNFVCEGLKFFKTVRRNVETEMSYSAVCAFSRIGCSGCQSYS
jgi:hypothetical protein